MARPTSAAKPRGDGIEKQDPQSSFNPKAPDGKVAGRKDEGRAAVGKASGSDEFGDPQSALNPKPLQVSVKPRSGSGGESCGGAYERLAQARKDGNTGDL